VARRKRGRPGAAAQKRKGASSSTPTQRREEVLSPLTRGGGEDPLLLERFLGSFEQKKKRKTPPPALFQQIKGGGGEASSARRERGAADHRPGLQKKRKRRERRARCSFSGRIRKGRGKGGFLSRIGKTSPPYAGGRGRERKEEGTAPYDDVGTLPEGEKERGSFITPPGGESSSLGGDQKKEEEETITAIVSNENAEKRGASTIRTLCCSRRGGGEATLHPPRNAKKGRSRSGPTPGEERLLPFLHHKKREGQRVRGPTASRPAKRGKEKSSLLSGQGGKGDGSSQGKKRISTQAVPGDREGGRRGKGFLWTKEPKGEGGTGEHSYPLSITQGKPPTRQKKGRAGTNLGVHSERQFFENVCRWVIAGGEGEKKKGSQSRCSEDTKRSETPKSACSNRRKRTRIWPEKEKKPDSLYLLTAYEKEGKNGLFYCPS